MEHRNGQFEALVRDIETEVRDAQGGWYMRDNTLIVEQQTSRDPRRSRNGGEYYLWRNYQADGLGVVVWEDWSCEIAPRHEYGGDAVNYDCIVSADGLKRIAQLADITIAARAWLTKEPGCMARLRSAILALSDNGVHNPH